MVEADRQQRQILLQQALDGADDELFRWAGHRFFTEAKIRLIQMPWDVEHPAAIYVGKKITEQVFATIEDVAEKDVVEKIPNVKKPHAKTYGAGITTTVLSDLDMLISGMQKAKDPVKESPKKKDELVVPFNMTKEDTLVHLNKLVGSSYKQWTPVIDAPIVKKKAYNPISLHIPKGGTLLFYKYAPPATSNMICAGTVTGFTKHGVKIKKYAAFGSFTIAVAYSQILFVATK